MTFEEAKELVRERMSYEYPTPELTRMPSKMAVSQLYPDLLDEDEEKLSSDESFDLVPRFLSDDDGKPSAAERGTATHLFMQFFDFDRVEKNGIEAEIDYLAAHRFIYPDDAKKIDVRAIKVFFESKIAEKMKKADKIWREKRFISAFEAEDFTSDEELKKKVAGEKILVQGVIDCAFADDDGKIVLVDYKTDHFVKGTPRDEIERTLRERHTRQLTYYKRACQTLFGEVKSVFVYSFALGDTVEIFTEDMI